MCLQYNNICFQVGYTTRIKKQLLCFIRFLQFSINFVRLEGGNKTYSMTYHKIFIIFNLVLKIF